MFDFCDGSLYKEHPLFSMHKDALQIVIYYDDVEVVNPLGSYRGVHKLGNLCNQILLPFQKYNIIPITLTTRSKVRPLNCSLMVLCNLLA